MPSITLVLLPGMEGTGQLFAPLIGEIAPATRVHVVRYPTDSPAGYSELIEYARAALPADGDYALLGESFSGPIAIALAAEAPPRLKGLILCCSFASNPQPRLRLYASLWRFFPAQLMTIAPAMRLLLRPYATPPLCRMLQTAIRSVKPRALLARLRAIASVNVEAELARVKVPLLYLQATDDTLVPEPAVEVIRRILPATKVVQIDGPHFLLQVSPCQAGQSICRFLAELQSTN